jgi:Fic family protein
MRSGLFHPTMKRLREKIALEWTYHSNAIEGNTLTLKETKVVLEGITVGGKSVKEHLEAINHEQAIHYLQEIVRGREELSEWQIKNIHAIILKTIDPEHAGEFRKENVTIAGAEHTPPDFMGIPGQVQELIQRYQSDWSALHPSQRAALLHCEFVKIHPFVDGNGRTARLLHNFELMKNGFPPIVIKKEQRLDYYTLLDNAHISGDPKAFIQFSAERLREVLDLYLRFLEVNPPSPS